MFLYAVQYLFWSLECFVSKRKCMSLYIQLVKFLAVIAAYFQNQKFAIFTWFLCLPNILYISYLYLLQSLYFISLPGYCGLGVKLSL